MRLHACVVRRRLAHVALFTSAMIMTGDTGRTVTRANPQQTQKVELKINTKKLSLVWNGDQGDEGRGRGEVYVNTWISWASNVQHANPVEKVMGPLAGDPEFRSGVVIPAPPGSIPPFTIDPGSATDGKFGIVYYNQADCPVDDEVLLDVLVWEEDSNRNLADYQKLITQLGEAAAAAGVRGANLAAGLFNTLLSELTNSSDDPLGRATNFSVKFPIPATASSAR